MHTNTIQYILSLVEQDISVLEAKREGITDRFLTTGSWIERDVLHGQLLALAKVKGRLEAMIDQGNVETPEEKVDWQLGIELETRW